MLRQAVQKITFGVQELSAFKAFQMIMLMAIVGALKILIAGGRTVAEQGFSDYSVVVQPFKMTVNGCSADITAALTKRIIDLLRREMLILIIPQKIEYFRTLLCCVPHISPPK